MIGLQDVNKARGHNDISSRIIKIFDSDLLQPLLFSEMQLNQVSF